MRRLLLVNALIFAVLAAAVALAYYSYSYTSEVTSRDRERAFLTEVAAEKVLSIETLIERDDAKVFSVPLQRDQLTNKLVELGSSVHVYSVFVLDEKLALVPGGYVGQRDGKESDEFRDWFQRVVLPDLRVEQIPLGERSHRHGIWNGWDGKDHLWSMTKRMWDGRPHYIVIEEDLNYLVGYMFPQFFITDRNNSKRLYQVIDERGELLYGLPFAADADAPTVPFSKTVDMWSVRVSVGEPAEKERQQAARKRLVDSIFIGGAVLVVLSGLLFLAFAIRRERRANELKSEFISNVSHELKTPLSIISMFGEMLANGRTKGPEQATEYADIIWRESVRLGRLIDNVLDFAKLERGKNVYEFVEADVGEVVERAVDLVGRRLTNAEMSISVEIEPELPLAKIDPNAFTLAVMNLIDNAIKYAAEGKKIELTLAKAKLEKDEDERILLKVRDFGPGIDPEEQEQIFERFYRARAVRLKPVRGSGIGLALVRHIARAHGGDVAVASEPGKGATFALWLPIP